MLRDTKGTYACLTVLLMLKMRGQSGLVGLQMLTHQGTLDMTPTA